MLNKEEKKQARLAVSAIMNTACERCVSKSECDSCPLQATMQSMYGLVEGKINWRKSSLGITAQKYRKLRHRNFNDAEIVEIFEITPKDLLDFKRKENLINSDLTDDDIREIRRLRHEEKWTYERISKLYNKHSVMYISDIAKRIRFAEVE